MRVFKTLECVVLLSMVCFLGGCLRGQTSRKPPIHPVLDMDDGQNYEAYEANEFFQDGAAMRRPIAGTVAREDANTASPFFSGMAVDGELVKVNPQAVNQANMLRGKERYGIYCQPCHGAVGDGKGVVVQRGMPLGYVQATSFHSDVLRNQPDGHIFQVITHGIRNMGAYGGKISPADRWNIVMYVRALQRSQNASASDVPNNVNVN